MSRHKGRPSAGRRRRARVPNVPDIRRHGADLLRYRLRRYVMTPLAGFIAAILAGWIIREPRRAAAAVLVPFLAVLGVQTWSLAAGDGSNPPSTIHGVSYWVVQVIILAFALGIATQLAIVLRVR